MAPLVIVSALMWAGTRLWLNRQHTRNFGLRSRGADAGFVPGAVAVVARHGEVHIRATGTLAFEGVGSGTPMAADTICRTGL